MFVTYIRKPYYHHTVHSVKRSMPPQSQILVKVGDELRPEKIVGIGRKSVGFRRVNAAQQLAIKPADLPKHMTKLQGSYVNKGDVLAEQKQLFGARTKKVLSPIKGVIQAIDATSGVITLNYEPEELRIVSGVYGTVSEVDPEEYIVTIKTNVLEVNGIIGIGNRREGSLHFVGQPDLPLSEKQVEQSWENKIIVGGSLLTRKVLYHCIALKVQGIITGGMHWEDYAALVGSRGRFEDVGISIILTEGFGNIPFSSKLHEYLHAYEGQFSFVEGATSKLVIPDNGDTPRDKRHHHGSYAVLDVGMRVRMHTLTHHGDFGHVKELRENSKLENGIMTHVAIVELHDTSVLEVPVTCLEIVEE